MAQFNLAILCVGLWLIGNPVTQTMALSDNKTEIDCSSFKCPEKLKCPNDSSLTLVDDQFNVKLPFQPFPLIHYRNKRDIESHSLDTLQQCCIGPLCSCNSCPKKPACKMGQVLIELSHGDGKPGSCCPQYECGMEPRCVDGASTTYWQDGCIKCNSCRLPCIDECEENSAPVNCLSDDDGQIKFHGDSWLQANDCVECTCNNGNKDCVEHICVTPECDNYKKVPGECCPVCPDSMEQPPRMIPTAIQTTAIETTTATEPSTSTDSNVTTEGAFDQSSSTVATDISSESIDSSTERAQLAEQQADHSEQEQSLGYTIYGKSTSTTSVASSTSELPEYSTESILEHGESTQLPAQELDSFESARSSTEVAYTSSVEQHLVDGSTTPTDIDNLQISSDSSSTTELPKLLATSAPAALTPESTSWHRYEAIDDADYRFAIENHIEASNQKYEYWLYGIFGMTGLAALIFFIAIIINWSHKPRKQRKSRYFSVPNSDSNLSDHTNISDVVTSKGQHSEAETA